MTPSDFLQDVGWKYHKRGAWLVAHICPFCNGGDSGDKQTFIVHSTDGNFTCSRAKCGVSGNFWKLIEATGREPRDYIEKKNTRKKKFVYGRT